MRAELQNVLTAVMELPPEQLPRLLGELEEIRCIALARLSTPAVARPEDQLLNIAEAARRLGVSKDYLYRHSGEFAFTRRMGRALRFSSDGIQDHLTSGGMPSLRRR